MKNGAIMPHPDYDRERLTMRRKPLPSASTSATTNDSGGVAEKARDGFTAMVKRWRGGRPTSLSVTNLTVSSGREGLRLNLPGEWCLVAAETDTSPYDPNYPIARTSFFFRELRTLKDG
jgi:hypothetical protein